MCNKAGQSISSTINMAEAAEPSLYATRFNDDCQVSDVVMDGIDCVLDSVQMEVDRKRLENMAVPLAADVAMVKLRRLMAWAVLDHDGSIAENVPLEYLEPDPEPATLTIDPWARGMVPTKTVKIEDTNNMFRTLGGDTITGNMSPRSQSMGSRVSSNTGTSRSGTSRGGAKSRNGTSRAGTATGTRVDEEENDPTGQIFDLEDSDDENLGGSPGHMSLEQLLKKQPKNKQGEGDAAESQVQPSEYELMQTEIESQVKDLKGKKYSIDREGHVIPLAPVRSAALPPYQVVADTKVSNFDENKGDKGRSRKGTGNASAAPPTASSVAGEPGTAAEGKKGKRTVRVAGSRAVDEYTFLPSFTLSDTLSTGDGLMPTSGVTINVNDQKRQGPSVPTIPGKMSRKEYAARSAVGGAALETSLELDDTFDAGSSLLQAGELAFNDSQVPLSMSGAGATQMRSEVQYKIPDIDVMAGSRRKIVVEPTSPTQRDEDASAGLGPVSNTGGGDPSIGTRPGPKDNKVRLFNHDVERTGKPTDRDLPKNMIHPSARTKPVAPPPGTVSKYDSPDKFAAARAAQGLNPKPVSGGGLGSPAGSAAGDSYASRGPDGGTGASRSKVGQMRTKDGIIKNEKPHVAAQIF